MQRKLSFTLGVIIFLGLGVWLVDRWSILPLFSVEVMDVVPAEASVVITIPRMEKVFQLPLEEAANEWEQAVLALPGIREDLQSVNRFIDTLFPSRQAIDRTEGLLSLVPVGNGRLAGTWIIDLRTMGHFDPAEWLAGRRLQAQSSSFRGQPVWTVQLPEGGQIALGRVRNLLILAKLPYQVEAALAAETTPVEWLTKLKPTEDTEALFSIYLNPQRWKELVDHLFTEAGRPIGYDPAEWLQCGRIDIYREGDGYRLEGRTRATGQWLANKVRPAPMQTDLWGMLPANTAGIRAINLEDYLAYFRQRDRREVGRFQRFFLPWIHGPVLEVTLRPFNAKLEDRQLYFFGFKDEVLVKAALDEWMEEVGILQNVNYQGFSMTQVYESESLFPFAEENWNNPWWTTVGNYLLISTSQNTLENWIDQYAVGNALPLTEVVRQVTLSESSGQFSFFLDWKQWRTGWQYLLADEDLAEAVSRLGQLSIRIKTGGEDGQLQGLWLSPPDMEQERDLSWRTVLSNQVAAGPWLCRDEAGDPLIAAQDATRRLYLMDGSGKVRWQQSLEGRILSEVEAIRLRNKTALTFNTAGAIHLLDLSGNPIDPFPLRLRNPTNLPQTVIDFSADQNYTFFTVSEDGCVYGYQLDGGPVPAWNPLCELGDVQQPLLHFQHDNKDYLVLQNSSGLLRAFARDGSLRLQADFSPGQHHAAIQWQAVADREQIVSCTDSGLVEVLPLKGSPIQFRLPVGNNLGVSMVYEDFFGGPQKDYLLRSDRTMALHTYTNRGLVRQFEETFPQTIDEVFGVKKDGAQQHQVGVLLKNNAKIYLFSGEGTVSPGFPLAGSTPFFLVDLFQTGELHLIVGYQDEILAYRLPVLQ